MITGIVSPKSFFSVVLHAAAIWAGASLFANILRTTFEVDFGFVSSNLFATTLYYACWLLIATVTFRKFIIIEKTRANILYLTVFVLGFGALIAWIYGDILPEIPLDPLANALFSAKEYGFLAANPSYVIPKSLDIALQQVLIAAFVVSLYRILLSVWGVSFVFGLFFSFAHFFLVLNGFMPGLTLVFVLSALFSAAVFPYLILKVKDGLAYSYAIHWFFYVAMAFLVRW